MALSVLQVRSGGKNIRLWLKVCKDALYTILKKEYPDILVLEYGIDHTGEMRIQTQIVEPDIALFTTLSPSHLDGFASVEEYYAEKQKLLCRKKKNTFAIGNKDDIHQAFFDCQMWYGHSMSDITFSNIEEYIDTTTAVVHYQGVAYTIQTPILG